MTLQQFRGRLQGGNRPLHLVKLYVTMRRIKSKRPIHNLNVKQNSHSGHMLIIFMAYGHVSVQIFLAGTIKHYVVHLKSYQVQIRTPKLTLLPIF